MSWEDRGGFNPSCFVVNPDEDDDIAVAGSTRQFGDLIRNQFQEKKPAEK